MELTETIHLRLPKAIAEAYVEEQKATGIPVSVLARADIMRCFTVRGDSANRKEDSTNRQYQDEGDEG